jgi:predicted MFS family arabinose efflux permease
MITDRADLPNAIALNSTMVNLSRVIGPSIGGVIIAAVGEAWCFLLDGVSYIAVIASLVAMRVVLRKREPTTTALIEELRDGFRYVSRFPPVRSALLLLSLVSIMGMPYSVLMPAVARNVLHGDSHTLGFLMTSTGLGALGGAFYLASRRSVVGLGAVIATAACTFGVGLVLFSLSRNLVLSLVLLAIAGTGLMVTMASTNTVLQTIVEERLRGRVMAFYAMAFLGTAPIGSLIAGVVADRVGPTNTIMLGGLACILGGAWFGIRLPRFRALVRPIYIERGIIHEE